MSMTIDGARFADVAKGGVVLKMEHTDARDIHPYCDCRTSLRKFLRDKIVILPLWMKWNSYMNPFIIKIARRC